MTYIASHNPAPSVISEKKTYPENNYFDSIEITENPRKTINSVNKIALGLLNKTYNGQILKIDDFTYHTGIEDSTRADFETSACHRYSTFRKTRKVPEHEQKTDQDKTDRTIDSNPKENGTLKTLDENQNPIVINGNSLCKFELFGECRDLECEFQHLNRGKSNLADPAPGRESSRKLTFGNGELACDRVDGAALQNS